MSINQQSLLDLICILNDSGYFGELCLNKLLAVTNHLIFHVLILSEHLNVFIFILEIPLLLLD
jgi:hypothetical protein